MTTENDVKRVAKALWVVLKEHETGWAERDESTPAEGELAASEFFFSTGPVLHEMARAALDVVAASEMETIADLKAQVERLQKALVAVDRDWAESEGYAAHEESDFVELYGLYPGDLIPV